MTPEEILMAAAEDIAEHGHHKGSYFKPTASASKRAIAPACAYGAMARAAGLVRGLVSHPHLIYDISIFSPAAEKLAEQIRRDGPVLLCRNAQSDDFAAITYFNDRPTTTGEDVILMMKKAATS